MSSDHSKHAPIDGTQFQFDHTTAWVKIGLLALTAAFVLLVLWSAFFNIDEVSKARGAVSSASETQRVESTFGGQISEIFVAKGDVVAAGTIIARFDPLQAKSELKQANAQMAAFLIDIEVQKTLLDAREADFSPHQDEYPSLTAAARAELLVKRELLADKMGEFDAQRRAKMASISEIQAEIPALNGQISEAGKALETYRQLFEKKLARQDQLIDSQQAYARLNREKAGLEGRLASLQEQVKGLQISAERARAEILAQASEQLLRTEGQLAAIKTKMELLQQRVDQTEIKSPIDGVILAVPDTVFGKVIAPGGMVAQVVPTDGAYHLRTRLSPKDIGFVRVGQMATVKIDAYTSSRYGAISGKVLEISPTTFTDQRTGVYYEVLVELEQQYFANDPNRFGLRPGMTGEADIITGSKSIFQYLWKPIYTNVSLAFSER